MDAELGPAALEPARTRGAGEPVPPPGESSDDGTGAGKEEEEG